MQAIFFALIAYLGWAIGDVLIAISARKIGSYSTTLWVNLLGLAVVSLYVPFALEQLSQITLPILLLNLGLGVLGLLGLVTMFESLRRGNPAVTGTIISAFVAVAVVLSIIFLGERISSKQAVAIVIITLGLVTTGFDFKEVKSARIFQNKGIIFAMIAMFIWGIYFTFIKIPVDSYGWFWPGFIARLVFPLTIAFMAVAKIKIENPFKAQTFWPVMGTALFWAFAEAAYNFGLSKGLVSVVAPIAGSYPTLFVILAYFVFKEKITRQQIAGILVTLAGIVILSIYSV